MPRTPLLAGNWKMNLNHLEAVAHVQKLARALTEAKVEGVEVAVLPPFTALRSVQTVVDGEHLVLAYGAQDLSPHASGAYTGDISGPMLAKLGCTYVVIGHSERRQYHGEDDELVNAKIKAAYAASLTPIVCVGEQLDVRREGGHVEHNLRQLDGALAGLAVEQARSIVIAYEPVWAIGTGEVATPEDAQEVCGVLRKQLTETYSADVADGIRILYGGSMKGDNAADLLRQTDVDGGLVGGASLSVEEFVTICSAAVR